METSDPDDFMTLLWLADHPGVELLGMVVTPGSRDQYQGVGKAMHDLVAAACALDEGVCVFEEVEICREKGEWGARKASERRAFREA